MGQFTATHTLDDGTEVGPKMHDAARAVVRSGPYASMNQLAIAVGPNGSQRFGYEIVKRARRAGLIELDADHPQKTPQARGAVVETQKAVDYLAEYDRPTNR